MFNSEYVEFSASSVPIMIHTKSYSAIKSNMYQTLICHKSISPVTACIFPREEKQRNTRIIITYSFLHSFCLLLMYCLEPCSKDTGLAVKIRCGVVDSKLGGGGDPVDQW